MAFSNQLKIPWVVFSTLLLGCPAGSRHFLKPGFIPPAKVAVLPFDNHTNDLNGPDIVRFWFNHRIAEKKGYVTVPLLEVDAALRELGIVDGGQLAAIKPQQVGAALNVDALIYGELLMFDYQTTGFLNTRQVRARFKMVDARTGERLWEAEGQGGSSSATTSSKGALQLAAQSLGTQWADKIANNPLRTETWDMIWNAIQFLPRARN